MAAPQRGENVRGTKIRKHFTDEKKREQKQKRERRARFRTFFHIGETKAEKSVRAEIRSRRRIPIGQKKKESVKGCRDGRGGSRRALNGGKSSRRSGFSDGKFKIECELALCAAAQGESRRRHRARRSRQDLKLLSNDWLGARTEACSRYLILPRHA